MEVEKKSLNCQGTPEKALSKCSTSGISGFLLQLATSVFQTENHQRTHEKNPKHNQTQHNHIDCVFLCPTHRGIS